MAGCKKFTQLWYNNKNVHAPPDASVAAAARDADEGLQADHVGRVGAAVAQALTVTGAQNMKTVIESRLVAGLL